MEATLINKLEHMDLSPEAYRLYCHLRHEAGQPQTTIPDPIYSYDHKDLKFGTILVSNSSGSFNTQSLFEFGYSLCHGETFIVRKQVTDLYKKCKIEYDIHSRVVVFKTLQELIDRSMLCAIHQLNWDRNSFYDHWVESITFLPKEVWK